MKRVVLLTAVAALGVLVLSGTAIALPAETPDETPMVDGPVRGIAQAGDNLWVGGSFSSVQRRDGTSIDNVGNVAVFDATTGQYRAIAPVLGDSSAVVRDIEPYGDGDLLLAGKFAGPGRNQKNLVQVNGTTGEVVRWFNAPGLQSVLDAPELGRIYGGGVGLSAFDVADGSKLWTRATTWVDPDLRTHATSAGYRDLELDGQTVWAACACDTIDGVPAKALAKLDTEGTYDTTWRVDAGAGGVGISVLDVDGALYLGAGGNDFLAKYSKANGQRVWLRDTSGSAQAVQELGGKLVVGGHFWEVGDGVGLDRCGFRLKGDPSKLEPFGDECQTRHGLAIYSFDGSLEPGWDPMVEGRYNLVWALHPDEVDVGALHFGGEFTTVNNVRQTFYGRLSEAESADVTPPVVQAPTHNLRGVGTTIGTSTVPVMVAWSAIDDASGVASHELHFSTDGGPYQKVATTTATSRIVSLSPGSVYRFRVRATDHSGNTSGWAEGPQFAVDVGQEEGTDPVTYGGTWTDKAFASAFGGSTRYAWEAGATATYAFDGGTDVAWVAQKGPNLGKAEVWIDGVKVQSVDLYATTEQARRTIFRAPADPGSPHTLEVRVLGTRRASSADTRVDVDAFVSLRQAP